MLRTVGRTDGPSYTCSVSWDFDPGKLIRPRSADSIKASGHGAASKGRTHDRKRPRPSRQLRKSLHAGGHPHMRHHRFTRISRTDFELSFEGVPKIGWSLASRAPRVGFATEAVDAAVAWGDGPFGAAGTVRMIPRKIQDAQAQPDEDEGDTPRAAF